MGQMQCRVVNVTRQQQQQLTLNDHHCFFMGDFDEFEDHVNMKKSLGYGFIMSDTLRGYLDQYGWSVEDDMCATGPCGQQFIFDKDTLMFRPLGPGEVAHAIPGIAATEPTTDETTSTVADQEQQQDSGVPIDEA